jgi:spore coat protein H
MLKKISRRGWFILISIIILIAGITKFRGHLLHGINTISVHVLNKQNVIIEADSEIDLEDIIIKWYGDKSLTPITFNAKSKGTKVPLSFGNNSFTVFYKDSVIGNVGHLKIKELKFHNYIFKIQKKENKIELVFHIDGADSTTIEKWNSMYHWTKDQVYTPKKHPFINLEPTSKIINNKIEIFTDSENFKNLLIPDLEINLTNLEGVINDMPLEIKSLKTRGRGSMAYRRKSFNVKLNDSVALLGSEGKIKHLKSFYLISLSMDPYYSHNKIALALLNELIGYDIFHTFTQVIINKQSQGVYMVIENPKNYMMDSKMADFILRRRYEGSSYIRKLDIDEIRLDYDRKKSIPKKELKSILNQYREIYKLLKIEKGEKLYNSLKLLFNIEDYMRLMAFNYLICNGDYSDEVYFYKTVSNQETRFDVVPWDFDDIFVNSPHEGWNLRNEQIPESTQIFSVENYLDLTVAKDPFLYKKYLEVLNDVVNDLQGYDIDGLFINTYNELYPYYADSLVIAQSRYDKFSEEYNLLKLEKHLQGTLEFLKNRIAQTRAQLQLESNTVK